MSSIPAAMSFQGLTVSDNAIPLSGASCPGPFSGATNQTTTCTASYVTTAADVGALQIQSIPVFHLDALGTPVTVTYSGVIADHLFGRRSDREHHVAGCQPQSVVFQSKRRAHGDCHGQFTDRHSHLQPTAQRRSALSLFPPARRR